MSPAKHSGPLRLSAGAGSISVDRGLAILELFNQRGTLGVKDAATALGIPRSTIHRYLVTLLELGWLLHDVPRRGYRLSAMAANPGLAVINATGLPKIARPELIKLRSASGCTARFAIRVDDRALIVAHAPSHSEGQALHATQVRSGAQLGRSTALAQALIANTPSDHDLRDATPPESQSFEQTRTTGFAMEYLQGQPAAAAIAVPVIDHIGTVVGALDLIGVAPQVTPVRLESHTEEIRSAAERLGVAMSAVPWLGWRRGH